MALADKGLTLGTLAPAWQLAGLDDKLVSLDQFQGQPVLLIFLRGTWCPNCRKQMETVRNEWSRVAPLARVIAIVSQAGPEVSDYLSRNPMPFPLLPDPNRDVIKLYGVYQRLGLDGFRVAYPTTMIIDQGGIVRYSYVGGSQFDRPDFNQVLVELEKLKTRI
ncbi:MAG: resA 1 [Chloroflexi bacterium]|jgi:peroxiredoxin|nr:resA 1 [Chloroflexota bacterium]